LLADIAHQIVRAAYLLALTVVPKGVFSPEPPVPENLGLSLVPAVLAIAAVLYGSARLRATVDTPAARAAAALTWLSVAAALAATLIFRGHRGPLERGVIITALPVWAALATTASVAAGYYLGSDFKNRRMGSLVIVIAAGALQYASAGAFLASPDRMWKDALRRDPANEEALTAVNRPLLRGYRYDDAKKLADRCLAVQPEACACLEARAQINLRKVSDRCLANAPDVCVCLDAKTEAALRATALEAALADAQAAVTHCPERPMSKTVLAETIALQGDPATAEKEAAEAVALGGREDRSRYVLALALQGQGRYDEANEQLKLAVAAGAGRDAKVLAGAIALLQEDLDGAEKWLAPLGGAGSQDAVASYNLALVADKRNNYNAARQGYLATLRIDPCYSSARYNLAHLTWKAGIKEEALHHGRKFAEMAAPGDPMVEQLSAMMGVNLRAPAVPEQLGGAP
jgi:tetratricopeptide (TPR) repeat protein